MIKRRKLKFQLGGGVQNILGELKPLEFKKKDMQFAIHIADNLQKGYDTRRSEMMNAIKGLDDLQLHPFYNENQKVKSEQFRGKIDALKNQYNNDITNPGFGQGLITLISEMKNDNELKTAIYNTSGLTEWQKSVKDLKEKGQYNPDFDINVQHYNDIQQGINKFKPFEYHKVIPYADFNKYFQGLADKIPEDAKIYTREISEWDTLVKKLTEKSDKKLLDYFTTIKDGFFVTSEGQTFKMMIGKNYNFEFDSNTGLPKETPEFQKKLNDEFLKYIKGASLGLSSVKEEDAKILTAQGALADHESKMRAEAAAKEKQAQEEKEEEKVGLFVPDLSMSGSHNLPIYQQPLSSASFDYKESYNTKYEAYNTELKSLQTQYNTYTFTDAQGKNFTIEEILDKYEKDPSLNDINISNNNQPLNEPDKVKLRSDFSKLLNKRYMVQQEAAYINEIDKEIKNNLLQQKANYGGTMSYLVSSQEQTKEINGKQLIKYKTIKDTNTGDILYLVTDDDKGYKDKILTPMEARAMYGFELTPKQQNNYLNIESEISQNIKQYELNAAKGLDPKIQSNEEIPFHVLQKIRSDENYQTNIDKIKKDVEKSGLPQIERDYLYHRINTLNANPLRYSINNDSFIGIDLNPSSKNEKQNTHISLAKAAITNIDSKPIYVITPTNDNIGKEIVPKLHREIMKEVNKDMEFMVQDNLIWNNYAQLPIEPKIIGYDMNDRIGGVWVARYEFSIEDLKNKYASDKDKANTMTTIEASLDQKVKTGILKKEGDKYILANYTILIEDDNVDGEYFKNVYSSDSGVQSSLKNTHNRMMSTFNSGNNLFVENAGNNNFISVKFNYQNSETPYSITYTDLNGTVKTDQTKTIIEAVERVEIFKQFNTNVRNNVVNSPYVRQESNSNALTPIMIQPMGNILNNIVQPYIGLAAAKPEVKKAIKTQSQLAQLSYRVDDNRLIFKNDSSNYASMSLINTLRQISAVQSIDNYNTPVYYNDYSNLEAKDRSDLSDNLTWNHKIDMNNPAHKLLLRRIFGTDALTISYPDNGSSNEIIITFN